MAQVRLKSLSLSGFRSFVDDCLIEFPETGLVLITGGSGWGKSSIPLGIAYALGFCPFPSTELTSWGGVATLKVELVLKTSVGDVRIRRQPNLQLWIDGEQVRGGTKVAEEKLAAILGLDPSMMSLLTYRGQKKPGLFLSKTDAEKKELLMQLLQLVKFEEALDLGAAKVKDLEQKRAAAQADCDRLQQTVVACTPETPLDQLETAISFYESQRAQIAELVAGMKVRIAKFKTDGEAAGQSAWVSFEAPLRAAKTAVAAVGVFQTPNATSKELEDAKTLGTEIQARLSRLETEDAARLKTSKAQLSALNTEATSLRSEIAKAPALVKERDRLLADLAKLKCDICPTCERAWEHTKDKKDELGRAVIAAAGGLATISMAEERLLVVLAEAAAVPDWTPSPAIAKFRIALVAQQERVATETQRLKGSVAFAKSEHDRKLATAQAEVHRLTNECLAAKAKAENTFLEMAAAERSQMETLEPGLRDLEMKLTDAKVTAERARTKLEQRQRFESQLVGATQTLTGVTEQLAAERDFIGLIGREGFLGSIFDEVLAEISDEANRILGTVANVSNCTIEFKSESVTQKDTVRKKIVPVMNVRGNTASLESGLSGGMQTAVELAVDLAVGAVVSRRSGACPGWLVLDESFEGLGTIDKESCMEILTRYAQDRLVLVIDHATEFRALFTKEIPVRFDNGRSFITEVTHAQAE